MIKERVEIFKKIEEIRGNPLIAYFTSIRSGVNSVMGSDSVSEIIKQLNLISKEKENVDFLIISNGGDPITALRIINILRERFKKVNILIPYVAYSAATLLALGGEEIIMHPYSNLGPVDPQLTFIKNMQNGRAQRQSIGAEDLSNYIKFIKEDVGVTDQASLTSAFSILSSEIPPTLIGASKRSSQLSISLSEKLLSYHIKDKNKASSISKALISSYYHHGYAVSRKEAKEIGLNIIFPDKELEDLLWDVWLDFEKSTNAGKVFTYENEITGLDQYKQFLLNAPIGTSTQFDFEIEFASVESKSAYSTNSNTVTVTCNKRTVNQIDFIPSEHIKGWVFHTL